MVGVYQLIKPEGPLDHLMLIKEWFLIVCKIFSINIRMVIDEMYCTIHYNRFVLLSTYHRQRKVDIKVKLILIDQ